MPVMDGYQAIKEIRKTNNEIPVIVQTGLLFTDVKDKILSADFDDYIPKPISKRILITTINKHLEKIACTKK